MAVSHHEVVASILSTDPVLGVIAAMSHSGVTTCSVISMLHHHGARHIPNVDI